MDWLKLARHRCQSFGRLDRNSRWRLAQAFVLLVLVKILLKVGGLKRTQHVLGVLPLTASTALHRREMGRTIAKTTQMTQLAAKYLQPWIHCLERSVTLWGLLRYQGITSDLRIGVQMEGGVFTAHAWVEYAGIALNDTQDVRTRFSMLDCSLEMNPLNH